jgi:SOS response regulatory protein OraA/RecX
VSDSVIASALASLDEEIAARQVAEAGARRLSHLEPRDFRRKLIAYMARRGFSYAVSEPLVEEMLAAGHCEVQSDMEIEGEL